MHTQVLTYRFIHIIQYKLFTFNVLLSGRSKWKIRILLLHISDGINISLELL